jgi:hypothetical protein
MTAIPLIDLRELLRRTVADGYGDLVTRRTGAAVRGAIERVLPDGGAPALIDFSDVRLLDLSCADEIVAKLLLQHGVRRFVIRGLSPAQRDALEPVLEHQGLAVVVQGADGGLALLGLPGETTYAVLEELRAVLVIDREGGSQPLPA